MPAAARFALRRAIAWWGAVSVMGSFALAIALCEDACPPVSLLERCLVFGALLAAAASDLRTRLVPDCIPAGLAVIHLVFVAARALATMGEGDAFLQALALLGDSLMGAALLGGGLLAFTLAYEHAAGCAGMGGGDLKLVFALGFAFGAPAGAAILLAACIAFTARLLWAGLFCRMRGGEAPGDGPFAPALAAGAFAIFALGV